MHLGSLQAHKLHCVEQGTGPHTTRPPFLSLTTGLRAPRSPAFLSNEDNFDSYTRDTQSTKCVTLNIQKPATHLSFQNAYYCLHGSEGGVGKEAQG